MALRIVLCVLVVLATGASPAAAAAQVGLADTSQHGSAYTGTHVSFGTSDGGLVDYAVGGETLLQSVTVQSKSEVDDGFGDFEMNLSTVTTIDGSAASVDGEAAVNATVAFGSGADMSVHDNSRGVFVLDAGGDPQYATVGLDGDSRAERESEGRVVVTSENGTQGALFVVGDGAVTVNDDGNVTAELGADAKLAFRSYPRGRIGDGRQQEQLIADGAATAEVYVMRAEGESDEFVADVVRYSEDTTVEVTEASEEVVRMTVNRPTDRGTVLVATLASDVVGPTQNVQVTVDGAAAAEASSYDELASTIYGGVNSTYRLRHRSSAEAGADVLVAVNRFSERQITMRSVGDPDTGTGAGAGTEADVETTGTETESGTAETGTPARRTDTPTTADGEETTPAGDGTTDEDTPGFGVAVAVIALLSAASLAVRRGA